MKWFLFTFFLAACGNSGSLNLSPSAGQPGCADLALFKDAVQLASDATELSNQQLLYNTLCLNPPANGVTAYYPSGRVATKLAGTVGATWYYDNETIATRYAGMNGTAWYYSSGKVITKFSNTVGASWYYPNGNPVTFTMGQPNSTWYYDNRKMITAFSGQVGVPWFYSNGQPISNSMGQAGASWFYSNGQVWKFSGPELTNAQLTNPVKFAITLGKNNFDSNPWHSKINKCLNSMWCSFSQQF